MEELRAQALDLLTDMTEEQVQAVLAYARCLRDGDVSVVVDIEDLVEESA